MSRRRGPDHGRIAFALDAGPERADAAVAGPDDDPAGAPADRDSTDGDTASGDRDPARSTDAARRRRRGAVVAAAAALVVVGSMVAVDVVSSREALQTVRRAVGGVEPLPGVPSEVWTADARTTTLPAALPGLFVAVQDDEAVALDLDTGAVRWTVPLPRDARCDPGSAAAPEPDDALVCVANHVPSALEAGTSVTPGADEPTLVEGGEVTVVAADGSFQTRALDAARGWSAPSPDGTVARLRRTGEAPDPDVRVTVDPQTGAPSDRSAGRPAVVTVEDARTGAVRWEHELPFVPGEGSCQQHSDTESTTSADPDGGFVTTRDGLVSVHGCGIDAWFTADGTRVDDPGAPTDRVARLPDGALSREVAPGSAGTAPGSGETPTTAVLEPDGEVRWQPPGTVLVPYATDGAASGLVLTREVTALVARDATGARRWESSEVNGPDAALVVAGGTAVVHQGMGNVVLGFDVETGRALWTQKVDELSPPDPDDAATLGMALVTQAFTDGARALLVVTTWTENGADTSRLVAVDLRDGRVAWRGDTTSRTSYHAVQGRLLRVDGSSVARLG